MMRPDCAGDKDMFNIEEELKKLPAQPGVYIMHDAKDEIIYVGKAISLKNRVRQYFQSSRNKGVKIEQMVTQQDRKDRTDGVKDCQIRIYRDGFGAGGPCPGV